MNTRIALRRRPKGMPVPDDFEFQSLPMPEPGPGEFLVKHTHIGLSPASRIRMDDGPGYAPPIELGGLVTAPTVGQIVKSRYDAFPDGAFVLSDGGWQTHSISRGVGAFLVDPSRHPLETYLGVLGSSGMTAYVGLLDYGKPAAGETVVVGAASGSVGSLVGQIAQLKGCRAVGIAGGAEKCRYVVEALGFDACIDHRSPDFAAELARACPSGIDIDFENIGGMPRDAAFGLMNKSAGSSSAG